MIQASPVSPFSIANLISWAGECLWVPTWSGSLSLAGHPKPPPWHLHSCPWASRRLLPSTQPTASACGGVPRSPSCPFLGLSVSPAPWSHLRARTGHPNLPSFAMLCSQKSFKIWAPFSLLWLFFAAESYFFLAFLLCWGVGKIKAHNESLPECWMIV